MNEKIKNNIEEILLKFNDQNKDKSLVLLFILEYFFNYSNYTKNLTFNIFENIEEIYADIVSFANNPNCSCRQRVTKYIKNNLDKVKSNLFLIIDTCNIDFEELISRLNKKFLNDFSNHTINISSNIIMNESETNENFSDYDLRGHIITIPADQENYKNLINSIIKDGKHYNGLFLLEKEKEWNIFFY